MKTVLRTLGQMLLLATLAAGVGAAANSLAGKDQIDLHRNYKPIPPVPPPPPDPGVDLENLPAPTDEHPYREVTAVRAKALFDDPRRELRAHVFIDARADHGFGEGHVPGALQCDAYRLAAYFGDALNAALQAERVIVYCNGGNCEDSLIVCNELVSGGVGWGKVYLFRGGWEEWSKAGYPVEKGSVAGAGE